jgi:hypothetical protein
MSRHQALSQARQKNMISALQRDVAAGNVVLHGADYIPVNEIRELNKAGLRLADPKESKESVYVTNHLGRLTQVHVAPLPK